MGRELPFIQILSRAEGGNEFLVNLSEAIEDGAIPESELTLFVGEVEKKLSGHPSSTPSDRSKLRQEITSLVFNPPHDEEGHPRSLTYLAKIADSTDKPILTFLTWQKLSRLVPPAGDLGREIRSIVDPRYFSTSDARPASDFEMVAVADAVNRLGPGEPNFRVSSVSSDGSAYPLWITHCRDFEHFGGLAADDLAKRMRDWLGLGHMSKGAPIFAFRSKVPLPVTRTRPLVGRPTIFDGIDNAYFKHRFEGHCPDRWGRTLDLEAALSGAAVCDGGPEAVTPGPKFGSLFECLFVGHLRSNPMPAVPRVLEVLLRQSSCPSGTIDDVIDRLRTKLASL
jgi:hypothetical protein